MSKGPKKDWSVFVRLPADFQENLQAVCSEIRQAPATLARTLLEEYVKAHRAHDGNLPWPPRFQHYKGPPDESGRPVPIAPSENGSRTPDGIKSDEHQHLPIG